MKSLSRPIGWLSLIATALAPVLFFNDNISEAGLRMTLLVATVTWFVSAIITQRANSN